MVYIGCMLIGLVAGFLSALLGIGGGVVVVPMLLILFGMDTKVAIGTSLAYIVPVAVAGALQHGLKGNVVLKVALIAGVFGVFGTYLGVQAQQFFKSDVLKAVFGMLMVIVGLKLLFMPQGWDGLLMKFKAPQGNAAPPTVVEPPESHPDEGS